MKNAILLFLALVWSVGVLMAQERTVSGVVTDAVSSEPLPQVNVQIKGTQRGTVTDNAGRYTLLLPASGATLVFFYTGYESKEVEVIAQKEVNVALGESPEEIEQVVVTGYQKIEKERSTGSYAILGEKEIARVRTKSLESRLQEVAAGVAYNSVTKQLQVRGVTSLMANAAPLVVLDGLPFEGTLDQINPSTVRSVTVLRDAAAASIYGAQAANGVIVVETTQGGSGFQVQYDGMVQVKPIASLAGLNLMSSSEYVDYHDWLCRKYDTLVPEPKRGFYSDDLQRRFVECFITKTITEAQYNATLDSLRQLDNRQQVRGLLERVGVYHSHSLMVSGGSDRHRLVGVARFEQERPNDKREGTQSVSFNLRNVSEFNQYVRTDIGMQAQLGSGKIYTGVKKADDFYRMYPAFNMLYGAGGNALPFYLDRDEFGIDSVAHTLGLLEERFFPSLDLKRSYRQNSDRWGRSNLAITITPIRVLQIEARGAMEYGWGKTVEIDEEDAYSMVKLYNDGSWYNTVSNQWEHAIPRGGRLRSTQTETFSYTVRLQANYDQRFGIHRITAQAGGELRERIDKLSSKELLGYNPRSLAYALVNEAELSAGIPGTAKQDKRPLIYNLQKGEMEPHERFCSYYATASYSLLQRYNLTGSIRVDQSNLWGTAPEVQWKPLWSVGASWQLDEESFMQNARGWLNRLVLRGSYGISGNVPRGAYPVLVVKPQINDWVTTLPAFVIGGAPNPKLRWEKTATTNVGVDWAMFNHRFSGTVEWYYRMTSDLLGHRPADPTLGWTEVLVNYGKMRNTGVELSLYGQLVAIGDFSVSANAMFSYNRSKLLEVRKGKNDLPVTRVMAPREVEGYPYGSLFSYAFAGLSPVDGSPQLYLHNGKLGKRAEEMEDLKFSGTVIPLYNSSLSLAFGWRGLDLTTTFLYYGGHVMRRPVASYYFWKAGAIGFDRDYQHVWKQPGDELRKETVPAPSSAVPNQEEQYVWSAADKHVLRADYIKFSALSLTYALPEQWLAPAKIAGLQVGFQVENIVNIPFNRAGVDPEMVQGTTAGAVRLRKMPPYYTVSLKLNI